MFKKIAALLLCIALIAGCSSAPSQPAASQAAPEASNPADEGNYTYKNPDPNMVLIKANNGDITYKDYRLYLDITEEFSRYSSLQQLAICHTIQKDLTEMGVEIDEQTYTEIAADQLAALYEYYPTFEPDLVKIAEFIGMSKEDAEQVVRDSFRMDYLIAVLGDHYQLLALEEMGEFDPSTVEYKEGETHSREEFEAQKRMEYEQKVYERAMVMLDEYSGKYNDRITVDAEKAVASVDGEAIEITDAAAKFIDYNAASSRYDSAAIIQQGEMVKRYLESVNGLPDSEAFFDEFDMYIDSVKADTEYIAKIEPHCKKLGATIDDYFLTFRHMSWLEAVGNHYYTLLAKDYSDTYPDYETVQPEESFEDFCAKKMDELYDGSEIVNVMG